MAGDAGACRRRGDRRRGGTGRIWRGPGAATRRCPSSWPTASPTTAAFSTGAYRRRPRPPARRPDRSPSPRWSSGWSISPRSSPTSGPRTSSATTDPSGTTQREPARSSGWPRRRSLAHSGPASGGGGALCLTPRAPSRRRSTRWPPSRTISHVGSHLPLYVYSAAQFQNGALTGGSRASGPTRPPGRAFTVRVAAIVRSPKEVNGVVPLLADEQVSYEGDQNIYVTPAFLPHLAVGLRYLLSKHVGDQPRRRPAAPRGGRLESVLERRPHHRARPDLHERRQRLQHPDRSVERRAWHPPRSGGPSPLRRLCRLGDAASGRPVRRPAGPARRRRLRHVAQLGATSRPAGRHRRLAGDGHRRGGGILAFAVAVAGSPLMPLGLARQAEIHPGSNVDVTVLIPGFLVMTVLIVARSLWPAWRVSRRRPAPPGRAPCAMPGCRVWPRPWPAPRCRRCPASGCATDWNRVVDAGPCRWSVP